VKKYPTIGNETEADLFLARDRCGTDRRGTYAAITEQRIATLLRAWPTFISSIYNKLGVSSRSAATRYAMEHHLA
jgi:hypothetical protein